VQKKKRKLNLKMKMAFVENNQSILDIIKLNITTKNTEQLIATIRDIACQTWIIFCREISKLKILDHIHG
jgi:hypothetical protein